MTKAEKYKKIKSLAKSHGEITVYFKFKVLGQYRKRKIRDNGHCFMSEGCYDPELTDYRDSEWSKYGLSCFIADDGGAKSISRTIKLMQVHDRGYLEPIAIKIGKREIKL